jgi:hypothetical protein
MVFILLSEIAAVWSFDFLLLSAAKIHLPLLATVGDFACLLQITAKKILLLKCSNEVLRSTAKIH